MSASIFTENWSFMEERHIIQRLDLSDESAEAQASLDDTANTTALIILSENQRSDWKLIIRTNSSLCASQVWPGMF